MHLLRVLTDALLEPHPDQIPLRVVNVVAKIHRFHRAVKIHPFSWNTRSKVKVIFIKGQGHSWQKLSVFLEYKVKITLKGHGNRMQGERLRSWLGKVTNYTGIKVKYQGHMCQRSSILEYMVNGHGWQNESILMEYKIIGQGHG